MNRIKILCIAILLLTTGVASMAQPAVNNRKAASPATLRGVVEPGTDVITEKGFEWKETLDGVYADLVSTSDDNTFSATLTGLTAGTNYTFRAYVKVGERKLYGEERTFTAKASTDFDSATQAISIYPNPASDVANIAIEGLATDATATIYDMQGRVIGKQTVSADIGKAVLDVSTFSNGTYIVYILSEEISCSERLIVKR